MPSPRLSTTSLFGVVLALASAPSGLGFAPPAPPSLLSSTSLSVSIGIGPTERKGDIPETEGDATTHTYDWKGERVLRSEHDLPEADHEAFRRTRLDDTARRCDEWFGSLLGEDRGTRPLGAVSDEAWDCLLTPAEIVPEPNRQWDVMTKEDPEWSPMRSTRLPGKPTYPAFGLETYGLPSPRPRAECWKQFDVAGMVATDYSGTPPVCERSDEELLAALRAGGGWLEDSECSARLVYVDGVYRPGLSRPSEIARHVPPAEFAAGVDPDRAAELNRLPDGHTDALATEPGADGLEGLAGTASHAALSAPDHNARRATEQHAINSQFGHAAFAALNSAKAEGAAVVDVPECAEGRRRTEEAEDFPEDPERRGKEMQYRAAKEALGEWHAERFDRPVLILNALTSAAGDGEKGTAVHPRTLVVAGAGSRVSLIQSCVDLDAESVANAVPRLYNGYTQIYIRKGAEVKHAYVQESGGSVTPNTEAMNTPFSSPDTPSPRELESLRPSVRDTHLETLDVQITGKFGQYNGAHLLVGGVGRSRMAASASLLQKGTDATIKGMILSGGGQCRDMRVNLHHVAPLSTSSQNQRNLVGGRSVATFRGRVRIEKFADYVNSDQLAKTLLLSDKATIWAMPSLEIIAPDVQCTHGATVSDLSDEEIFYFQTRGLTRMDAKNLLMYGFIDEIGGQVEPCLFGKRGSGGLKDRLTATLSRIAPQGEERDVKWDFQSI